MRADEKPVSILQFAMPDDEKLASDGKKCVSADKNPMKTMLSSNKWRASASETIPAPREWAKTAAPFLLKINSADNGKQLTVPN
jgi:hypothetical protein